MDMSRQSAAEVLEGELLGSMLVGLVRSLKNVQVISSENAANLLAGVKSNDWYPMASFFSVLDEVRKYEVNLDAILFQAGVAFVRDWYENGQSRVVSCAADFLRMQSDSGGYSMAHRGEPDKIGQLDLVELEESGGYAKLVCITPYPREFERGVFYGGVLGAGDVDHVRVESVEEPCNRYLSKKTIEIFFHKKPDKNVCASLDEYLANLSPESPSVLPGNLTEALAWRLKTLEQQSINDRLFYEQSHLLLSKAAGQIYDISKMMERLAQRDALTDLLNRRAIVEIGQNLLSLAARGGWPVGFIMIDIDHFKSVNDTFGHAAGDDTLCSIAALLKSKLRESDLLGRIGGEEFLVVLPQTDLQGACTLADNLRVTVQQHVPADGRCCPVTISLGVTATSGQPAEEIDCCIRQADQALYMSKQNGRNQVSVFAL